MRARLHDLTMTRDGAAILSLRCQPEEAAALYDDLNADDVEVKIAKASKHRSLDANAYAWVLIGKIAQAAKLSRLDVYRQAARDCGADNYDDVCVAETAVARLQQVWQGRGLGWISDDMTGKGAYRTVRLYCGSSAYTTAQMSALIDHLIDTARDYGIETMPQEYVASLLERWT